MFNKENSMNRSAGTGLRLLRVCGLLLPLCLAGADNAATPALTPAAYRDLLIQPAVVFIQVRYSFSILDYKFTCPSHGTGFIFRSDGYIITNGHVVQMANMKDMSGTRMEAVFKDISSCLEGGLTDAQKQDVFAKIEEAAKTNAPESLIRNLEPPHIDVYLNNRNAKNNGQPYKAEIKSYSDPITQGGKDIAIIKIDENNLPTVPLGDSDEVRVGERLTVIGYPGLAEVSAASILVPSVTHGEVSAVNKTDEKGTPLIQAEATIDHGNSGGPAFNDKGDVVAIATFKTASSGLNFFIPINTAMEFVRAAGAPPKRGPFDALWKQALDAYAQGHWKRAHYLLGNVVEVLPGQPDARKLMQQAGVFMTNQTLLDRVKESFETTEKPVLLGAGLILFGLLAGGVVLFVFRHGKTEKPTVPQERLVSSAGPTVVESAQSLGSLHVSNGPTKGRQYMIPECGIRIGRDADACTVVIPMETVGREHAWVMPMEGGQVAVIDRGSSNGTYLNSIDAGRIKKVLLKPGDRILVCHDNPIEIVYQRS